MRILVVS